MPNPFGPLGGMFLWSLLELNQNLWFFRPANTDRPFASSILNTKTLQIICVIGALSFFIKLWKILFIHPFDITQFIYNSCKTEATKTKMSCMLSHHIHILITQFYENLAPRERIELPSFGS